MLIDKIVSDLFLEISTLYAALYTLYATVGRINQLAFQQLCGKGFAGGGRKKTTPAGLWHGPMTSEPRTLDHQARLRAISSTSVVVYLTIEGVY